MTRFTGASSSKIFTPKNYTSYYNIVDISIRIVIPESGSFATRDYNVLKNAKEATNYFLAQTLFGRPEKLLKEL
jgi:hypothetical protein